MANPKRRHSAKRRASRRGGQGGIAIQSLSLCPHCRQPKPGHRVCPSCGYYNGRQVVVKKEKKTKKES